MRIPADADPQFEAAARQVLQARDFLGDEDRVAQRRDQDPGGEPDPLGAAGGKGKRLQRRQPPGPVKPARGQQMLDRPQRLVTERLRSLREVPEPRRFRIVEVGEREARQHQPETHLEAPQERRRRLQSLATPARKTAMTEFTYDHVHLRSPNPDETAAYFERMFAARILKWAMWTGLDGPAMNLGGAMVFIAKASGPADLR